MSLHLPNAIVPVFWVGSHTLLHDFMYDTIYNAFVTIPRAVNISKFVGLAVSAVCFVISFWCLFNNYRGNRMFKDDLRDQEVTKVRVQTSIDMDSEPTNPNAGNTALDPAARRSSFHPEITENEHHSGGSSAELEI